MAFEDIKLDYANRAQSKILELTELVDPLLFAGDEAETPLAQALELLDFQEVLLDHLNPWDEDTQLVWIEYYNIKYDLVDIPYISQEVYAPPIVVLPGGGIGGDYVTHAELIAAQNALNAVDISLSDRITILEDFDYSGLIPQLLLDDVADLKTRMTAAETSITSLQTTQTTQGLSLTNHINDNVRHLNAGERTAWNLASTKSTANELALVTKSDVGHTHTLSEVDGLNATLNAIADQISGLPIPEDGQDGVTPSIIIGTVESVPSGTPPEVTIDGTPESPILNFKLERGEKGEGFQIDTVGDFSDRSLYENEAIGYTFLAQDTNDLYFLMAPFTWSDPIPFKGNNGWTPRFGLYVQSSTRTLLEILGYFGGQGTEPVLGPPGIRFFVSDLGYTNDENVATNLKGPIGPQGIDGRSFIIDQQGTDRAIYDSELRGFTFLNTVTGKISWKLTDANADWSTQFQWSGSSGGGGGLISENVTFVLSGGKSFGKYVNGQTANWTGLTVFQAIKDAAIEYINPSFGSVAVTGQATVVDIGTELSGSRTFTWSINQGSGVVTLVDIYDISNASNLATDTPNDGSESVTINTKLLDTEGETQQWRVVGKNTSPAGTFNSGTLTVTARSRIYYGPTSSNPSDSATIKALPSSVYYSGGNSLIINTGTTEVKFAIWLPLGKTITSATDLNVNATITSAYTLIGSINVNGADGVGRPGNLYVMTIGATYSSNHQHSIVFN